MEMKFSCTVLISETNLQGENNPIEELGPSYFGRNIILQCIEESIRAFVRLPLAFTPDGLPIQVCNFKLDEIKYPPETPTPEPGQIQG